jgi:hypothetical protein
MARVSTGLCAVLGQGVRESMLAGRHRAATPPIRRHGLRVGRRHSNPGIIFRRQNRRLAPIVG